MPTGSITDGAIRILAIVVASIIPLFIIAILVDSSKGSELSDQDDVGKPGKTLARQSRRTLLAIAVGVVVEFISFIAILSVPNSDVERAAPITIVWLIFTGIGIIIVFYVMFIPHIELHVKKVQHAHDPKTENWTIIVGWSGDVGLIVAAWAARFIGNTEFDHLVGYIFGAAGLVFSGAMIAVTIGNHTRRNERRHSGSSQPSDT